MTFSRFLDPKNDFLFKRLFGTEKNKDILIGFLNSILNLKPGHKVEDVTYLSTIQDPEVAYKKQSIVDVLCKDQTGTQFIIEMQVARTPGFEERAQFYAARAYINQMKVGGHYQDLKEVIFIAITDYVMFPEKSAWKSDHVTTDKVTKTHDLKAFSYTFIELPKFQKTIDQLETDEEKWAYFFKHATETTDDAFKEFIKDKVLMRAFDVSTKYSMTEIEWNTYEAELKHEWDARAIEQQKIIDAEEMGLKKGMEKGMEKGKVEGKAEGEKAKAIEVAKGMVSKKMDIALISELTGLSKEDIELLK